MVTVPAYFDASQKEATKDAAKIAGLQVLRIISEPTAAAMAAGIHENNGDQMVVVFDFGGGTFDVSILDISNGTINVESTQGDMNLGGRDLDQILVDHCLKDFQQKHNVDLSEDKAAKTRLMQECERAKINLSNAYSATVKLTTFYEDKDLEVEIKREDFEQLAMPVFEKLAKPLDDALSDAAMSVDEITEVLLVGGSSRIPWVRRWLEGYFQKPPNDMLNADEGVAFGATVMAALCCNEDPVV